MVGMEQVRRCQVFHFPDQQLPEETGFCFCTQKCPWTRPPKHGIHSLLLYGLNGPEAGRAPAIQAILCLASTG